MKLISSHNVTLSINKNYCKHCCYIKYGSAVISIIFTIYPALQILQELGTFTKRKNSDMHEFYVPYLRNQAISQISRVEKTSESITNCEGYLKQTKSINQPTGHSANGGQASCRAEKDDAP